ncbi:hypothetical protein JCM30471_17870 [Desulfuromonas carbonis]|nr:hypothetical protein [Desulfuromonas sp. DDH964]AMV73372.1 hypothetical protein DBW_3064 [Desulfuromonas sp. DDH964]
MHHTTTQNHRKDRNFLDYLLYTLAAGVIAAISFSFLLWLRY